MNELLRLPVDHIISAFQLPQLSGTDAGGIFAVFAIGCTLGITAGWTLGRRKGASEDQPVFFDEAATVSRQSVSALMDSFNGMFVELEKVSGRWRLRLLSRGATPQHWQVEGLAPGGEPLLLSQVIEDEGLYVLESILNTAVQLDIPVNYECRLKNGQPEPLWVALQLSKQTGRSGSVLSGIMTDIMERRLMERELLEEKQFADQILEYSGVIFSVRDSDMKLIRTNKAFIETSGYTPEELYFSSGDSLLLGDAYEETTTKFKAILQGAPPIVSENPWYCKDGTTRLLRWTNSGLRDMEGKLRYVISVGIDITDLRMLEERLQKRVEEFSALFDNSMVGIAMVVTDHVVKANQICGTLLGYSPEEIEGLPLAALFPDEGSYGAFKTEYYPKIERGLRHFDHLLKHKGGRTGEFRVSVSPISGNHPEEGLIIVLDDVSDIRTVERALLRSETRFRTIVDKMAAGLALITEDGYFKEVNESWCRITGYSREEARRLHVLDITYREDADRSDRTMKSFLSEMLDMTRMEKRYIKKDGTVLWVDLTASCIDERREYGEITLVSIINDITDRKRIEEELMLTNARLEMEKDRAQLLADHRMAVIELFDIFRKSQAIEDVFGILKNTLPAFVKYRNLMAAVHVSRFDSDYVIYDALEELPPELLRNLVQNSQGIVGEAIRSRMPYRSGDLSRDPYYVSHHPDVKSYLAVPILYKDFLWGVIGMDYTEYEHFREQDVEILSMVCTLIAMQLEEMAAKKSLQEEAVRLRKLHDLVQEMALMRQNGDVLTRICESGIFPEIHIYLVDSEGLLSPCTCPTCIGRAPEIPTGIKAAIVTDRTIWYREGEPFPHSLALCIRYNEKCLGVIEVCSETGLTEQESNLASILAEQTGVFMELNELIARREHEAMIDPLTGVWNRRYVIGRLRQEEDRMGRYGGIACVAILDMGDFKQINDVYGHLKGDEVLISAAALIETGIRRTDYVGRYGGDEFIVFLPGTSLQEAEALFEKIRSTIASHHIEGIPQEIEIDFGVAEVPTEEVTLLGGVRAADERMYNNKRERKRRALLKY